MTDVEPRTLGKTWISGGPESMSSDDVKVLTTDVNIDHSLWKERWPAIALEECREKVREAPPDRRAQVKFDLPCSICHKASACLNAKKKGIGSLMYARELLTKPTAAESTFFPRELFMPMLNPSIAMQRHFYKPEGMERDYAVAQAWDLAWSERTGGDYLVCMTAVVDLVRGHSALIQIERWRQLTFDQQCKLIELKWRQYGSQIVVIESDASQRIWSQHMSANTSVPVVPHTARDKRDLANGVPGILIDLQNQKWTFPFQRSGWGFDEMENFLNEAEAFGWVNGKLEGVGEHDDTVMCFWHLWWGIRTLLLGAMPIEGRIGNQPGRLQ